MKRILFIASLCLYSVLSYAQEIKLNEVDEFTGNRHIETSWERINKMTMKNHDMKISFSYLNNKLYLRAKIITGFVCSIPENSEIMFKSNDGICKLKALEYTISSTGGGSTGISGSGAMGVNVRYVGDMSFLEKSKISKVRVYFRDSYLDIDISEKGSDMINKSYSLVSNL